MQQFEIGANEAGQRLDKYLKKLLKEAPSSFFYKMMRKKNIVVNGKKAEGAQKLALGDEVTLFLSDDTIAGFRGEAPGKEALKQKYPTARLSILYEDKDILVINKPAGMLSQKARPEDVSANEYIIGYLLSSGQLKAEDLATFTPSVCNRIDRNTSGILIAGKSLAGLKRMGEALRNRDLLKYYQCLVTGNLADARELEGWLTKDVGTNQVRIGRERTDGSSYIRTGYRPLSHYTWQGREYTLLKVQLITGKSHQIRAHLASIGHPVLGDRKYGGRKADPLAEHLHLPGQLLHAWRLVWPEGKTLTAPLPERFQKALQEIGP